MSDRGMKKWNAYKALPEQTPEMDKAFMKEQLIEKPILTVDRIEEINDKLVNYHGQTITVTYFKKNKLYDEVTTIKKIDVNNKKLILNSGTIVLFENLINLE